jgi:hypothetical protein
VLETARHLPAVTVSHVAAANSEILSWLETKRQKGEQTPKSLELASQQIGKALRALSETSFSADLFEDSKALRPKEYAERLEQRIGKAEGLNQHE